VDVVDEVVLVAVLVVVLVVVLGAVVAVGVVVAAVVAGAVVVALVELRSVAVDVRAGARLVEAGCERPVATEPPTVVGVAPDGPLGVCLAGGCAGASDGPRSIRNATATPAAARARSPVSAAADRPARLRRAGRISWV
jgi:hypothetical protein